MKVWLKGGLIGILVSILIIFLSYIFGKSFGLVIGSIGLVQCYAITFGAGGFSCAWMWIPIIIIDCFIIGVIISLIVSKIKSKKIEK